MLVWLASFPRSGSSLTQQILWQCFGISVAKVGGDAIADLRGPSRYPPGTSMEEIARAARADSDLVVVKTHELPSTNEPAIVVVRDARPVMLSYARFRTDRTGSPVTIDQAIAHPRMDWSRHVAAWLDHDAPKLVLRYERLKDGNQDDIDAIARFLDRPQIGRFATDIASLRAQRPTHVREGGNEAGIAAIEREHSDLFWNRHGAVMARLGYAR